jgi:hypothetical protein
MSAKRSKSWVEVGRGEDSHYDWASELAILDDLNSILMDLQYVDRELKGRKLSVFLSKLREYDPEVPKLKYFENAFDLIQYHSFVDEESEFFDPDMPVSSIWKKVYVKRSNIKKLVKLLELAKVHLESYCEREKVAQLREQKDREYDLKKKQEEHVKETLRREQERDDERQKRGLEEQWVTKTFSKIEEAIQDQSGIVCIDDFLIDTDNQEIFVLTKHKQYRYVRPNREYLVTHKLIEKYTVHEIEESSPPGSGHIPYFAGGMRQNVIGWQQNKSVLCCNDKIVLERANIIREKYIQTLTANSE